MEVTPGASPPLFYSFDGFNWGGEHTSEPSTTRMHKSKPRHVPTRHVPVSKREPGSSASPSSLSLARSGRQSSASVKLDWFVDVPPKIETKEVKPFLCNWLFLNSTSLASVDIALSLLFPPLNSLCQHTHTSTHPLRKVAAAGDLGVVPLPY